LAETIGGAALLGGGLLLAPEIAGLAGGATAAGDLAIGDVAAADLLPAATADLSGAAIGDIGAATAADLAVPAAVGADLLGLAPDLGTAALATDVSTLSPFADTSALAVTDTGLGADVTAGTAADVPTAAATLPQGTPAVSAVTTPAGGVQAIGVPATSGGTVAGAGGGAGGGITSTLGNVLSSPWTKLAIGAAPLALTLAMGEQQLPSAATASQNQALQLQQLGLTNLAQAQAGQLNAGQTAQLATMKQNLTNQWLQTLYNQGVTDPTKDSRWPQIQALIDQQVTASTAQLIQQNITNALAETGQASTALTQIAQLQMQSDQNFTNNLINATKALGLAVGSGQALKLVAA
jgi:hypothetical protein